MSETISEPFTSVNCPFCGALIPFFTKKDAVSCSSCGAELKIGYEQQPIRSPEPPGVTQKNPFTVILLRGFAEWLNKEDENNEH